VIVRASKATSAGEESRRRVVEMGVRMASAQGLSAISLSTLAAASSLSKSGLFAHFRSKESLLVAIIDEAERCFDDIVVRPAQQQEPGAARLDALVRRFIDYMAGSDNDGRCFLAAVEHEFEGKPGPVKERIHAFVHHWYEAVTKALDEARQRGQIEHSYDAKRFCFAVMGFGLSAHWHGELYADPELGRRLGYEQADALMRQVGLAPGRAEIQISA
jgi:AcrR family transcriptional regulator